MIAENLAAATAAAKSYGFGKAMILFNRAVKDDR